METAFRCIIKKQSRKAQSSIKSRAFQTRDHKKVFKQRKYFLFFFFLQNIRIPQQKIAHKRFVFVRYETLS